MRRRTVLEDKKCPECGFWFTPTRKGQIFCSDYCRGKNHERKQTQRRIENGRAGKGYCPYGEDCFHCKEADCIAQNFSGYFEPEGLLF